MRKSILALLLAVLFGHMLGAQDSPFKPPTPPTPETQAKVPPKGRTTIGVALEGGGALGQAHIGVLKWFEEHHIPIDYLAGTSMGGLVGGMYATGLTPDELQKFVSEINWDAALGNKHPKLGAVNRRTIAYY